MNINLEISLQFVLTALLAVVLAFVFWRTRREDSYGDILYAKINRLVFKLKANTLTTHCPACDGGGGSCTVCRTEIGSLLRQLAMDIAEASVLAAGWPDNADEPNHAIIQRRREIAQYVADYAFQVEQPDSLRKLLALLRGLRDEKSAVPDAWITPREARNVRRGTLSFFLANVKPNEAQTVPVYIGTIPPIEEGEGQDTTQE